MSSPPPPPPPEAAETEGVERSLKIADGFCSEMAPRSRNGRFGNLTCTVAPWVGGSKAAPSGSRNTTRWLIEEGEGRWKMNCVSDTACMFVWTCPGVGFWLARIRERGEGGKGRERKGRGAPARPAHIAPNMVVEWGKDLVLVV